MKPTSTRPFWQQPLHSLDREQWERLCDGCGRCCLHKLEDADTAEVFYTRVACRFFHIADCRCSVYPDRLAQQPECLVITAENIGALDYLPESCAYRLRAEGMPLPPWHPLVSGNAESVHTAGVSVRAYALPLAAVSDPDDLEEFIIDPP